MNEASLVVKVTLGIYKDCIIAATQALIRNWIIIPASIAVFFLFIFVAQLVAPLGIAGGFILGLLSCALISLYYSWIHEALERGSLKWRGLTEFDMGLFMTVISVSFILFLISYITGPMWRDPGARAVLLVVYLLIVLLFNALPEVTYIHRYESINAFTEAARFTKENWIEWYIPFVVLLAPWIILSSDPVGILQSFALMSPLLPTILLLSGWSYIFPGLGILGPLLGLVVATWFMIFRGKLFQELEKGTRRRRIYLAKQ